MSSFSEDPFFWCVDLVVGALCHDESLWADKPAMRPTRDLPALESLLRANEIDGETLLEHITFEILKNDLGITNIRERTGICHGIQALKQQSAHYTSLHGLSHIFRPRVISHINELSTSHPLVAPPTDLRAYALPNGHLSAPNLRTSETLYQEGSRKRRRLQLGPAIAPGNSRTRVWPSGASGFLGLEKHELDSTFYGDKSRDKHDLVGHVSTDDEISFTHTSKQKHPPGLCQVVQRRLQRPAKLVRVDRSRYIWLPYSETRMKEGSSKFGTLFTVAGGEVTAQKRNALFLDSRTDEIDQDDDFDQDGRFDHLVRKEKNPLDDEVYPLYGESDSEVLDDDFVTELEQDAADKLAEASSSNRKLAPDVVKGVIDEAIETHVQERTAMRLALRQRKAWSLWNLRSRHATEDMQAQLVKLETRLSKLKRTLMKDSWKSEKMLTSMCAAMQPTVYAIEECKWKLALWAGPRPEPDRSAQRPRGLRKSEKTASQDESGEDLDSEDSFDFTDHDHANQHLTPTPPIQRFSPMHIDIPQLDEDESRTALSSSPVLEHDNITSSPPPGMKEENEGELSGDSVLGRYQDVTPLKPFKKGELIDLTLSPPPASPTFNLDFYGPHPEEATPAEIAAWSWRKLQESGDRLRIVMKALFELPPETRRNVQQLFIDQTAAYLQDSISKAIRSIKRESDLIDGISDLLVINALFKICRLWICWHWAFDASHIDHTDPDILDSAIDVDDFTAFHEFMLRLVCLATTESPGPNEVDADEEPSPVRTKRKRPVAENAESQKIRLEAHERHREAKESHMMMELSQPGSFNVDNNDRIAVNAQIKAKDDEFIYLHPEIARHIKPHQIQGVQFMWRELMKSGQGCLLAHTMGLGKTFQTIAVIATVAEAAESKMDNIRKQLPGRLHSSRTLILCPPILIQNWKDEFEKWLPNSIRRAVGYIAALTATVRPDDRLDTIEDWHTDGGILIMSYDLFRICVMPKDIDDKEQQRQPDKNRQSLQDRARKYLLSARLVIADEAHKLKNPKSKLSMAVSSIKAKARIALTGSPLANNLQDYFAMIDWVAPNYLGDNKEFKANYQEPIEAGLYADSTISEQRRSLKFLHKLKKEIGPKIDRADITVLQGDLPPKTEFVIKVPLTQLQKDLYCAFLRLVRADGMALVNTRIFAVLHALRTLVNHPAIFETVIKSQAVLSTRNITKIAAEMDDPVEEPLAPSLAQQMALEQQSIFSKSGYPDTEDHLLSSKMRIIGEILHEAKRKGDQTLVFSHSIPTLDYLARFLKKLHGIYHVRLDGQTKMSDRMGMIGDFAADGAAAFLISTRAGALGLNITSANRVILVDFDYSPSHEEQAVGRAYRIGQNKTVYVYHLVTAGTYESKLHETTIFKQQVAYRVVDDKKPSRYATKASDYIFDPFMVPPQSLDEFRHKDSIMDHMLDGPMRDLIISLDTTETMHAEKDEPLTEGEMREVDEMMRADKERKVAAQPKPPNFPLQIPTAYPGIARLAPNPGHSSQVYERQPERALESTPGFLPPVVPSQRGEIVAASMWNSRTAGISHPGNQIPGLNLVRPFGLQAAPRLPTPNWLVDPAQKKFSSPLKSSDIGSAGTLGTISKGTDDDFTGVGGGHQVNRGLLDDREANENKADLNKLRRDEQKPALTRQEQILLGRPGGRTPQGYVSGRTPHEAISLSDEE